MVFGILKRGAKVCTIVTGNAKKEPLSCYKKECEFGFNVVFHAVLAQSHKKYRNIPLGCHENTAAFSCVLL